MQAYDVPCVYIMALAFFHINIENCNFDTNITYLASKKPFHNLIITAYKFSSLGWYFAVTGLQLTWEWEIIQISGRGKCRIPLTNNVITKSQSKVLTSSLRFISHH